MEWRGKLSSVGHGVRNMMDRGRGLMSEWFGDSSMSPRRRFKVTRLQPCDAELDYTKQVLLGMGRFGRVHTWQRKSDDRQVAIRQLLIDVTNDDVERSTRDERLNIVAREIKQLIKLGQSHVNLVTIHDVFFTGTDCRYLYAVMEYCSLLNLSKYMQTKDNRAEENILDVMHQCACGLDFLHARKPPIIHGSIKLSSILFQEENLRHIVKLGDFCLFDYFHGDHSDKNKPNTITYRTLMDNFQHTSPFHNKTLPFVAPETFAALEGKGLDNGCLNITPAMDVFALGIAFAFMVAYNSDSDYVMLIRQGVGESVGEEMWLAKRDDEPQPEVVDHADDDSVLRRDLKQLVLDMTQYSVRDRLSVTRVLLRIKHLVDARHDETSKDRVTKIVPAVKT